MHAFGRSAALGLAIVFGVAGSARGADSLCADIAAWPFGADERMVPTAPAAAKPVDFLKRVVAAGFPYPKGWRERIAAEPANPPIYRLLTASALVNGIKVTPEPADLWKAPGRFFAEGGDCEDAAIAKYALLRDIGYKAENLRMTVVHVRGRPTLHMILVVRTGPTPFETVVLDNAGGGVRAALYCEEMKPLISLNENAVWRHAPEGERLIASLGNVCTAGP